MANQTDLVNRSNGRMEAVQQREAIAPAVDVYENADELLLLVDVPGATNDGMEVQLDKGQLTILAKRREDAPGSLLAAEYRACDYSPGILGAARDRPCKNRRSIERRSVAASASEVRLGEASSDRGEAGVTGTSRKEGDHGAQRNCRVDEEQAVGARR